MFQKILVCVDGSERSIEAARIAAELAKVHKASLTLLHAFQLPSLKEPFPGAPTFASPLLEQYERDIKQAVIERTLPAISAVGEGYDVMEEIGDPIEVIARNAGNQGYDLIVMGGRNMGVDKIAQLGSISHGVLCRAHCPVLVVR
jgi:nucleotide-binding universal stress UspA family protein